MPESIALILIIAGDNPAIISHARLAFNQQQLKHVAVGFSDTSEGAVDIAGRPLQGPLKTCDDRRK
jgi:hypothetical protein